MDGAIQRATRELIEEVGYRRLTMGGVARRAGVSEPTLRLRWRTKAELVQDAVFLDAEQLPVPDTGTLESDLRGCVRNTIAVFSSPAVAGALFGLIDDARHTPGLGQALLRRIHQPSLAGFQRLIDRAVERGEAVPALDADVLMDILTGAVLTRLSISGRRMPHLENQLVAALLAALRPPPRHRSRPAGLARPGTVKGRRG